MSRQTQLNNLVDELSDTIHKKNFMRRNTININNWIPWIPIKLAIPGRQYDMTRVLVVVENCVDIGTWMFTIKKFQLEIPGEVTHWVPLPDTPEDGSCI